MVSDNAMGDARIDYIRIANYYYKAGLTQAEIAKCMNMSRQRVNRILAKCIELGIVRISIEGFENTHLELEMALEKKYKLKAVRISESVVEDQVLDGIGKLAAEYLVGIIKKGDIIGFSRGRSISALVDHMPSINSSDVTVTQLMGSWNEQEKKVNVDEIINRFCKKTNAKPNVLYAPVVVNNPEFREAIMNEPFFCETYRVIKACSIAVVGIGDARHRHNLPILKDQDFEYLQKNNAVGEVSTHFFDIKGESVIAPFSNRVIAVELADFLKIDTRIGVAGQKSKVPAILGALRGKYINSLITDLETAVTLNQTPL